MKLLKKTVYFWLPLAKKYSPLLILVAVAVFFRYTGISFLPNGLFPDEAANGLDVNSILNGYLQPFYERGNGREALFFYMLTPAVWLLGRTPLAHHLVSATLGILVVIFTYLLFKRWFTPRVAFLTGFFTAVSSWYVTMSRTAFRANAAPLFTLLFFYFATRVIQSKNKKDYWASAVLSGISFGLGFYTYITFRMMIPIVGLAFLAVILYDFRQSQKWGLFKKFGKAFTASALSFIATMIPLGLYFFKYPEWLVGRSGQVSIFSENLNNGDVLGTFLAVLGKTFMGFITTGDLNWRHNVPGFPFLSFLVAPIFVVGMIFVIIQSIIFVYRLISKNKDWLIGKINFKRFRFFIITIWLFLMLVPEVLTAEGIPHGLRLIGIMPVVFVFPALFIEELIHELPHQKTETKSFRKGLITLALVLFLGAEMLYSSYLYFGIAGNSPEYARAFRSDLTQVSKYLNLRNDKEKTYLVLDWFSEQSIQYMTTRTNQPYQVIDPATLWEGPENIRIGRHDYEKYGLTLNPGDQAVFTQSTLHDIKAFEQYYPEAEQILEKQNRFRETVMVVYQMP